MRKPEFVYVSYIETTPERWEALTSSEFSKRDGGTPAWCRHGRRARRFRWCSTARPPMSARSSRPIRRGGYHTRHILNEAARNERPTRVTFVIEPHGRLVKLTLKHRDFAENSVILDGTKGGGGGREGKGDALFIDELEEVYRS